MIRRSFLGTVAALAAGSFAGGEGEVENVIRTKVVAASKPVRRGVDCTWITKEEWVAFNRVQLERYLLATQEKML